MLRVQACMEKIKSLLPVTYVILKAKHIILAGASEEAFDIRWPSSMSQPLRLPPDTRGNKRFPFIYAYIFSDFTNVGHLVGSSLMWENSPHRQFRAGFFTWFFWVSLQARFSRTTVEPLLMPPPLSKCAVPDEFHERVACVLTLSHTTFGPVLHASGPFMLSHVRKSRRLLQPLSTDSSLPCNV